MGSATRIGHVFEMGWERGVGDRGSHGLGARGRFITNRTVRCFRDKGRPDLTLRQSDKRVKPHATNLPTPAIEIVKQTPSLPSHTHLHTHGLSTTGAAAALATCTRSPRQRAHVGRFRRRPAPPTSHCAAVERPQSYPVALLCLRLRAGNLPSFSTCLDCSLEERQVST
ncbi:hypothetical protein BDV95DRAFT_20702 [Massariosphaeria phaeospora]|uniref:Uncharacterized protein n=1 Tax=Massariosphaeria phaeospora TaxID=100035 RepID=A0A7C8IK64_9PLEO|nr:hypothetical protein BDV95DRAFT_20702 [Massariosphaeria phaeospora]